MPRIFFFLFFLFSCLFSYAQQIDGVYSLFKKDGSRARNIDQATFFIHQTKESDTLYVRRLYNKSGPMIKWESYKDPSCEIPNGIFAWYNEKGTIDSSCRVVNGVVTDILYLVTDDKTPAKTDVSSTKAPAIVQVPAEFDGGLKAWTSYLTKTLETPDRFTRLSKNGTKTTVGVSFSISTDGGIYDVFIEKSSEWSVDMESIRVIKNSPHWKPAVQNGKTVIDKHKQNLTYAVN
ncbi:MAG: TonB family protein [Sediminibacterium sp.]|nr:TonB family protein [Sediminibacterium sp.]